MKKRRTNMKSVIQKSIAAMLVCIALFSFVNLEAHADHYADPNSRISIYNQYLKNGVSSKYHETSGYWDDQLKSRFNLKLNSGYISGRGCALLTFAHAIQWFEGKASSDRQIEILRDLIKQSNNPPSAISTYKSYIQSRCNLDCVSMNYKSITEDQMKQLFDKDGFIVMYGSQHVSAACGYRTHNGKLYVLFVDSTCRSTLKRLNDKGASALSYELGSMANYANGSNQAGGRYWVPFDQFKRYIADYCSYWFTKKGTNSTPTSETPVISGEIKPTGSLPQGKSFGLRGTISCKYTLTNITAVVKDTVAGTEKFNVSVTPNTTSYTIGASGEQINNKIAFGTLPVGYYNYKVTATISSGTYTLIDSNFTIGTPPAQPTPSGSAQLTASASSMAADGTFTVTLGIKNNPGFAAMRLANSFSGQGIAVTKMELIGISQNAELRETATQIGILSNTACYGDGPIVRLTFKVDEVKDVDLSFECLECRDNNVELVQVSGTNIKISAANGNNRIPGDVNNDNEVDMGDVLLVFRYVLEWPGITINMSNADVNRDDAVDMGDVLLIFRYVLEWPGVVLR